ncbi:MAG: site-specific DNA-methyltransferase [Deltaproteobacteria bacterium]|nr:site-specific DNA-methyltransferase [Deltaproteobacteria bacterium]HCH66284.1 site-specific DNA-methyltransferase [Deltaproteobacteria bacterium]
MQRRSKPLELTWIDKDEREPVEPHTLVERPESSCGTPDSGPTSGPRANMLIHGDNLLALAALERDFAGKVKCIYIDPPYNTGSDFEHYSDGVQHSAWLSMMRDRLERMKPLLHEDGIIFVQIDDRELAYLHVLMDEVFGRPNRVNLITVKMSEVSGVKMKHVDKRLPKLKEFILVYGKRPNVSIHPIRVTKPPERLAKYLKYYTSIIENPDDAPESWRIVRIKTFMKEAGLKTDAASVQAFQLQERHRVVYRTNNRMLARLSFPTTTAKVISPKGLTYIWWEGKQMLFLSDHCEEYLGDLWTDISTINLNKEGGVAFRYSKKPEALIRRVIELSTQPGDLVLDAFAGSGTTAAVAHKLGRRWIAIERGDHCISHALPRLQKVVSGADPGGISTAVGWSGGGAFRCYTLALRKPQ